MSYVCAHLFIERKVHHRGTRRTGGENHTNRKIYIEYTGAKATHCRQFSCYINWHLCDRIYCFLLCILSADMARANRLLSAITFVPICVSR